MKLRLLIMTKALDKKLVQETEEDAVLLGHRAIQRLKAVQNKELNILLNTIKSLRRENEELKSKGPGGYYTSVDALMQLRGYSMNNSSTIAIARRNIIEKLRLKNIEVVKIGVAYHIKIADIPHFPLKGERA